ncbi:MAG: glycosyltransferase family 9 protein [Methylacidiphilales bacterium]|nr:glycosyltransferase family 9 protein [Candidatus Methylacidiphilales bacterium]
MNLPAFLNEQAYRLVFNRLSSRRPPRPAPIRLGPHSKVLVFSCAGIGDTLTDSVVFKALAETWPGIHLAMVVHRRRRMLADHNPCVNAVFTIEKGPLAFYKLHKSLKQAGPWDAILQLRGNDPEPRCQGFLLNPDVSVSIPQMTRYGRLCGHILEQPDWEENHGVVQTLRMAEYLGAHTTEPHLAYLVNPSERTALESKLSELGLDPGKQRIVFQIGGGRRASWRDWPMEHYIKLIRLLAARHDASFILLGGPDQKKKASAIQEALALPSVHNLAGQINLAGSAALLQSAECLISTDTGIMHLGFAVGTRVVALIHCNNPAHRVGPYGYGDRHRVVQLPRPVDYHSPADASMSDIRPEQVLQKIEEILK